jgi:hypothetical protein
MGFSLKKLFFFLLFIFLLPSVLAGSYQAHQCEHAEDDQGEIWICPQKSGSPNETHLFEYAFCNNSAENYSNYHFVLGKFDKKIDWIDTETFYPIRTEDEFKTKTCVYDYNVLVDAFPETDNPHLATCFYFDVNESLSIESEFHFNYLDPYSDTFYVLKKKPLHGFVWENIQSLAKEQKIKSDYSYYLDSNFTLNAGECIEFTVKYRIKQEKNGKFSAYMIRGDSIECLENDSCEYSLFIDPSYWNINYKYRRQLTITNNASVVLQDQNIGVKINFPGTLGVKALANCNDVRLVFQDGVNSRELDRNILGNCQSDFNLYFDLNQNIVASGTDGNYFLYYGYSAATSPENSVLVNGSPDYYSNVYCPADYNTGQYSVNLGGIGNNCSTAGTMRFTPSGMHGTQGVYKSDAAIAWFDSNFVLSGSAYTIEFWAYFVSASKQRFAGVTANTPSDNIQFIIEDSPAPAWHLRVVAIQDGVMLHDLDTRVVLSFNEWHHLSYSCGSAGAFLYYDWNMIGYNASTSCLTVNPASTFTLGVNNGGGSEYASTNTRFDDLRISPGIQRIFRPQEDINAPNRYPSGSIGSEEVGQVTIIDVLVPDGTQYIGGLTDINLYFRNPMGEGFDINFGYSAIQGANDSNILTDFNATNMANCGAPDGNFDGNSQNAFFCAFQWNTSGIPDGNYFLNVRTSDGGTGSSFSSFYIDNTAPYNLSITINNGDFNTSDLNVLLTLSGTDGFGSGVSMMRFSNDSLSWSDWEAFDDNKNNWMLNLYGGSNYAGVKTVFFELKDDLDNVSAFESANIYLFGVLKTVYEYQPFRNPQSTEGMQPQEKALLNLTFSIQNLLFILILIIIGLGVLLWTKRR